MITEDAHDQVREQPYSSVLIQCWGLSDGKQRIKVQHIQIGEWTDLNTFARALVWIDARCDERFTYQHG